MTGRPAGAPITAGAVAWALLMAVDGSPLAWALDHDVLSLAAVPLPLAVPGYVAGWLLMVAAMMLPAALTVLPAASGSASQASAPPAPGPPARFAPWLVGYLGAWALAGLAFAGLDLVLHALLAAGDVGVPRALFVAWGFVWVAVASRLLRHPRRSGSGWLHGLACVATCAPAMLALQAVAPGDLRAMAIAGVAVTALRLGATRAVPDRPGRPPGSARRRAPRTAAGSPPAAPGRWRTACARRAGGGRG